MTDHSGRVDVAAIAAGLSEAEKSALTPLTFFSDATGERLLHLGLFASREGWPMTQLGVAVATHIQEGRK